jgi:hypothetical protein
MVARRSDRQPHSRIDFAAVAAAAGDLRHLVAGDLGNHDGSGKWLCPFHAERTGSLHVYEDHFHCFGCGEHGDALTWVLKRHGLSAVEAARRIAPSLVAASGGPGRRQVARQAAPVPETGPTPEPRRAAPEIWTDPAWQARLGVLIRGGEETLWSPGGRPALDWLTRRGLSEETIRRFRLGFFDTPRWTSPIPHWLDHKGRPRCLRMERGIAIPWLAPGAWYSAEDGEPEGPRWVGMNVRLLASDVHAPLPVGIEKYRAVAGSKRGRLYPFSTIEPTQGRLPMLLVEGEFDALLGHQEVGHLLHVATAGSASTLNLSAATRAALARCTWLLLALDRDAAGAEAARQWRELYPHKSRRVLLPAGKDLNEFHSSGGDLVGWLDRVLPPTAGPRGPPK